MSMRSTVSPIITFAAITGIAIASSGGCAHSQTLADAFAKAGEAIEAVSDRLSDEFSDEALKTHSFGLNRKNILEAKRHPYNYLVRRAASNNGVLDNLAVSTITPLETPNAVLHSDDILNGLRRCIVGVVGITPIPIGYRDMPTAISVQLDAELKTAPGFRPISQSDGIMYLSLASINNTPAVSFSGIGGKENPIAVSTACMAFFYAQIKVYADLNAEKAERASNEAATKRKQSTDAVNGGRSAFEKSIPVVTPTTQIKDAAE